MYRKNNTFCFHCSFEFVENPMILLMFGTTPSNHCYTYSLPPKILQETRGVWHFWLVHIFQVVATQEGMQACLKAGPSWVDSLTWLHCWTISRINPAQLIYCQWWTTKPSKWRHFLNDFCLPPLLGFVHSCFSTSDGRPWWRANFTPIFSWDGLCKTLLGGPKGMQAN